jgi:hypothetical protein
VRGIGHRHQPDARRHPRRQRLDQRQEGQVKEQHPVLRMVHDPGDLVGKQPRVDRVAHRPQARDGVIQFQMPVAIPGQRRHPVAGRDAHRRQTMRQLRDAPAGVGQALVMDAALDRGRHDAAAAMHLGRVIHHRRYRQRPVHHQTLEHSRLLPFGRHAPLCRAP